MTTRALAQSLVKQLAAAADPDYRRNLERLVPGGRVRGVRVPQLRQMATALMRGADAPSVEGLCDLMDLVAAGGYREEILVAIFALARSKKQLASVPWERVLRWLPAIDNWETCDQLATNVAAPILAARPALASSLDQIAGSKRGWERRFALATAVGLNQRGRRHPEVALRVVERVIGDADPNVQKAIGWAMREVSQQDPAAAYALLVKHKARLSPRVLRESAEKLAVAQRRALGVEK